MKASELIRAMSDRLSHDQQQVSRLSQQLSELSSAYNRYLDLQREVEAHVRSIEKLTALLAGLWPEYPPESMEDLRQEEKAQELRKELELWEAVQQYLRFAPSEARVRDIVEFLELVDMPSSRQAVEAAINAHPKTFAVKKRRRDKFVSLKHRF
jgi:hypothetical protein